MENRGPTPPSYDEDPTIRDGRELKRVLRIAGYSQRELGDYLGCSRSFVNNVCNDISPLTLRVAEGVRRMLGDDLYRLALIRARQVEVAEWQELERRRKFNALEAEYQREQARKREEQRRADAIAAIQQELEGGERPAEQGPPDAMAESDGLATELEDGSGPDTEGHWPYSDVSGGDNQENTDDY